MILKLVLNHENLARRLGLNAKTLLKEPQNLTNKEFLSYTRSHDPALKTIMGRISRARIYDSS